MKHFRSIPKLQEVLVITYTSRAIFEPKSATLRPGAHVELERVAGMINHFPLTTVDIQVESDTAASGVCGKALQKRRAQALKAALSRQGIHSRRIRTRVSGRSQTLCPGDSVSFKVNALVLGPMEQVRTGHQAANPYAPQECWAN